MRFMMLVIPNGYETAEKGALPDAELVAKMTSYNDTLKNAGALVALRRAASPVGELSRFVLGRKAIRDRWAVRAGEGGNWRLLDDPSQVEGRGSRMGQTRANAGL